MSFCGKTAAKHIEGFVNGCHPADMDDFVSEFTRMHNTIEQKAVQLLIKTILRVSETPYPDGRNEAGVKACKMMIEGYRKELIADLLENDSYYSHRPRERAETWVRGGAYDISWMPCV